jgi:HTH-type transcriptional regulator/antitoxin HipB
MDIDSSKAFGDGIKLARKASQITQKDLAMACGVGLRFIQDLEKGKPTCELDKAIFVARMLGLTLTLALKT